MPNHGPEGFVRVPESQCLNCGYRMNALGTRDGIVPAPDPGDVTVCLRCGAVMRLDEKLRVRGMTDREIDELISDPAWMAEIARMVRRVHFIKHSKG